MNTHILLFIVSVLYFGRDTVAVTYIKLTEIISFSENLQFQLSFERR